MAASNLAAWFKLEMVFEGGKVDHPKDPGGRTNMGVTQRVYDGWRKQRSLPRRDVYLIEAREVIEIFKTGYWDKVWGDRLPAGLDIVVADGAINSGPGQAIRWMQRALNDNGAGLRVDGVMGDATLTAAQSVNDVDALIVRIIALREAFLRALRTWSTFGRGWLSRITQVRRAGTDVAAGSIPAVAIKTKGMERKALIEDAKAPLPKLDAVWGAGTGTGVIAQAVEKLSPLSAVEQIATVVAWLTAAGAVLAVIGFAWAFVARKRNEARDAALGLKPTLPANDNVPPPEGMEDEIAALEREAA